MNKFEKIALRYNLEIPEERKKYNKKMLEILRKEEADKEAVRKSLQHRSSYRVKIICPNCGTTAETKDIDTHKTVAFSKRCKKCHLKFEWKYQIEERDKNLFPDEKKWFPRYSRITVYAHIFLGDIHRFQKYNEKTAKVKKID